MSSGAAKPLVVGIAGGSASGKTTLARRLAEALPELCVQIIHMDQYFRPIKPVIIAPVTRVPYEDFNHPESYDLCRLVTDLDARLLAADCPQVIVIEGLMTLHDEDVRARLDLGIFVDAQSDERLARRLKRNMGRGMDFDQVATFFLDTVRYRHQEFVEPSRWHADIVLNGTNTSERGIGLVVGWIRQHAPDAGSKPASA